MSEKSFKTYPIFLEEEAGYGAIRIKDESFQKLSDPKFNLTSKYFLATFKNPETQRIERRLIHADYVNEAIENHNYYKHLRSRILQLRIPQIYFDLLLSSSSQKLLPPSKNI